MGCRTKKNTLIISGLGTTHTTHEPTLNCSHRSLPTLVQATPLCRIVRGKDTYTSTHADGTSDSTSKEEGRGKKERRTDGRTDGLLVRCVQVVNSSFVPPEGDWGKTCAWTPYSEYPNLSVIALRDCALRILISRIGWFTNTNRAKWSSP